MRDPDLAGAAARAWRWAPPEGDTDPLAASHVTSWFVNGPFHPHWSWWVISAIDLLERPGVPSPHRQYPEAEHEILILSLSPDWTPDVEAKPGAVPYLTPADLVYQLDGVSREHVAEIVELMVRQIVAGQMSPDSDYRESWRARLDTTVAHYKEGRHG